MRSRARKRDGAIIREKLRSRSSFASGRLLNFIRQMGEEGLQNCGILISNSAFNGRQTAVMRLVNGGSQTVMGIRPKSAFHKERLERKTDHGRFGQTLYSGPM